MDRIASPKKVKEIVARYQFQFSKKWGQNFLIDYHIIEKIVAGAGITDADEVLEIGPGIGSLTQGLAEAAKRVVAIEIDSKLIPILSDHLKDYENVTVLHEDVLKVNLEQLFSQYFSNKKVKVLGNLPYYITTPIIMKFLEEKAPIDSITMMIQKEVADRIGAQPGTKDYGALSVAVQYYCSIEKIAVVPPTVFIPQPSVQSSVIKLNRLPQPRVMVENEKLFFGLVKDAFGKRRKTLLNALSTGSLGLDKVLVKTALNSVGIDEQRRGETLSVADYGAIANRLWELTR